VLIFDLAAQHGQWLAARQATAASNIANVNTPGYKAMDVAPFAQVLDQTRLAMAANSPAHLQPIEAGFRPLDMERERGWDITYSGNTVTLETELLKVGENARMQSLDTGLTRLFHRMILTSLKVS
jgi:flagellar basal-body rod protein FlgB